jgi:nucleoside-diphosphate-sugar epimerase
MICRSALVTGGTGFLGSALCRRLLEGGVKVTLLARPGSAIPNEIDDVAVVADIADRSAVAKAITGRSADVLFHLASYGVAPGDRDLATMFLVNVAATDAVVRAAPVLGARAFVFLGSCSEYAPPPWGVRIDETAPLAAKGIYGASKAAAGLWGQALARQLGANFMWLRLFNVFGPGEAAHRLAPSIIRALSRGEEARLSAGTQVRDYLFVDDAVEAVIQAGRAALEGRSGPYNVCTGEPIAVRAFAETVADVMRKPLDLLRFGVLDYRPDDYPWLVGDPSRFQHDTGFRPATSLRAGIEKTIAAAARE